jgi:hypothetical protein
MKRFADLMIIVGATVLTGGGGYVVVLGHVARVNRTLASLAVLIAMLGAACLTIGLLYRSRS